MIGFNLGDRYMKLSQLSMVMENSKIKKNVLHMECRFLNKRPMDRVALLNNNFESRSSYLNMKFFIL